jgi:hypothetical protein
MVVRAIDPLPMKLISALFLIKILLCFSMLLLKKKY